MSDRDTPPPLDDDVSDLVRAERRRTSAPEAAKNEVRAGIDALLTAKPGHARADRGGGTVEGLVRRGVSAPGVVLIAAAAFTAGGLAGVWWDRRQHEPPADAAPAISAPAPPVITAPPVLPSLPSSAPSAPSSAPAPQASRATAPAKGAPEAGAGTGDASLAKERALIDRARSAIARGRPADALDAVDEHARAFPKGQLAEEREVLAVQALAQAGRIREATERAAQFRKRWPESVLTPVVDEALR